VKNKKKYLALIRSFSGIKAHMNVNEYIWKKLSKNFDKVFFINDDNLKFFPNYSQEWMEKEYNYEEIYKHVPKNVVLFNPKNSEELSDFLEDKTIIAINQFRKLFQDIKTHYLMKKHNIKQIQISNFGHGFGMTQHVPIKHFFKFLNWYNKIFFKKITSLLGILGIVSKIDIRFISDRYVFEEILKHPIKNFLYKKKLLFTKELVLINSRSYDILLDNKFSLNEDYIVHFNANLNYWQEKEFRGELDEKQISLHYHHLENFLKKLSKEFNKEVIICIHPGHDLEEAQNFFKDFKVVKLRTREFIYKAFLVTNFDSSVVDDAILLKKRAIGFISDFMTKNEVEHTKSKASICGYMTLNTKKDFLFNKEEILSKLNKNIINYEKNIAYHHCVEPNINGTDKMIKIIKERFF